MQRKGTKTARPPQSKVALFLVRDFVFLFVFVPALDLDIVDAQAAKGLDKG